MPGAVELWRAAAVLIGLVLFGIGYNAWVARLERAGHDRGYMSLIVSLGVAVTIIGWVLIRCDWIGLVYLLTAFAASGAPMIVGSIRRHLREREDELAELRRKAGEALK